MLIQKGNFVVSWQQITPNLQNCKFATKNIQRPFLLVAYRTLSKQQRTVKKGVKKKLLKLVP